LVSRDHPTKTGGALTLSELHHTHRSFAEIHLAPDHHLDNTNPTTAIMGRVRTKTVKKSAKVIIERYYPKLTLDFETNKRICDEIAIIASKRLRNKVRARCNLFIPS
jgi:ribosomal protein S17E